MQQQSHAYRSNSKVRCPGPISVGKEETVSGRRMAELEPHDTQTVSWAAGASVPDAAMKTN